MVGMMLLRNTLKKIKNLFLPDTGSRAKDNASKRLIYDREVQANFIMGRNVSDVLTCC